MKPKTVRFGRKIKGMGGIRHLSDRFAVSSPQGEPFYFAQTKASPLRGGAAIGGREVAASAFPSIFSVSL